MISAVFGRAFKALFRQPGMLWGLSVLSVIITLIATAAFAVVPVVGVAIAYVLTCGMAKVYVDGINGKTVNSDQMFEGFDSTFLRKAGGMAWRDLWLVIWLMVPVAGPIIYLVKSYSYAFVPYILMTKPEVKATQALRMSMELTDGKKFRMFLADIIWSLVPVLTVALPVYLTAGADMVFSSSGSSFNSGSFAPVLALLAIAVEIFLLLFSGIIAQLYKAAFYAYKEEDYQYDVVGQYGGYSADSYSSSGYGVQGGGYGQQAVNSGYGSNQMMSQPVNTAGGSIFNVGQQYYQQAASQGYVCANCGARYNSPTAVCMSCGSRMQ